MNPSIKISLFHCLNSISSTEINRINSQLDGVELDAISVPCSGKVATEYFLKSIETGSDIAIVVGCMKGECKFLQGNLRAQKRIEAMNDLLIETGMSGDCIWFIHLDKKNKLENIISELIICIRQIINEHAKAVEIE
jgi:coenzyme F420-reducing hydrogenase delta subunit